MTQAALGKEVGVTAKCVLRWEKRLRVPARRYLPKLVTLTGLSPAQLLNIEAA